MRTGRVAAAARNAGDRKGRHVAAPRADAPPSAELLQLQAFIGNRAVTSLLRGKVTRLLRATSRVMRAPGPLSAAQEADAVAWTTARYDERSIRIIQIVTGSPVTGVFDDVAAQAVATFQAAQGGLVVDGKVGPRTLNRVIPNRAAADRREHAIQLVIDLHNLDVDSDTLTVRFDPALAAARATDFEPGGLRIVRLGAPAFTTHFRLFQAIRSGLRTAAPAAPAGGARPAVLSDAEETAAVAANLVRLPDPRSARAVQGHVRSRPDGIWGPDTVQRVARAQGAAGIPATGIVDEDTLRLFVTDMIAAGNMNAPIRLIVDFFFIVDDDNLLTIFFDPTVGANATTDFRPDEPVRIRMGPRGMAQPFPGIVHTIAHEFEHVRRLKQGERSRFVHEFLGEAVEIVSAGMPEEDLESVAPGAPGFVPGFANDAGRALSNWNQMTPAEQSTHRARFLQVRQVVRDRIAAGTPAQQALHATLLANYNAVVVPP